MKRLSAKQLEMNEYIINKIESYSQNTFTTDELVELGIFSSNGWAYSRRKNKLLPKYIQYGPRNNVNYEKEQLLEWIKSEIKAKSYLLQSWNRNLSIFHETKSKTSPGLIETESMRRKRKLLPNYDPCGPRVEDTKSEKSSPCIPKENTETSVPVPLSKEACKRTSDAIYNRLSECIIAIIIDENKEIKSEVQWVRDKIYKETGYQPLS